MSLFLYWAYNYYVIDAFVIVPAPPWIAKANLLLFILFVYIMRQITYKLASIA